MSTGEIAMLILPALCLAGLFSYTMLVWHMGRVSAFKIAQKRFNEIFKEKK